MAQSQLTVRTLCLATIALVLACGHAARAMGQTRGPADKQAPRATVPQSSKTIRVVPAGSGHSTVATTTGSTGSGGGRSGTSKVMTFTSKGGGSAGNSVVTFTGDRVMRQASASAKRPAPTVHRRTASATSRRVDAPVIAVRRPGEPAAPLARIEPTPPKPAPAVARVEQKPPAAVQVSRKSPSIRNAFGSLPSGKLMLGPDAASASRFAQVHAPR